MNIAYQFSPARSGYRRAIPPRPAACSVSNILTSAAHDGSLRHPDHRREPSPLLLDQADRQHRQSLKIQANWGPAGPSRRASAARGKRGRPCLQRRHVRVADRPLRVVRLPGEPAPAPARACLLRHLRDLARYVPMPPTLVADLETTMSRMSTTAPSTLDISRQRASRRPAATAPPPSRHRAGEARFPHAKAWCCPWIEPRPPRPHPRQARDWEPATRAACAGTVGHRPQQGQRQERRCYTAASPPSRRCGSSPARRCSARTLAPVVATLDGTLFRTRAVRDVIANQIKGARLTKGDWDESLVFDASFWLPVLRRPSSLPRRRRHPGAGEGEPPASCMTALATLTVGVLGTAGVALTPFLPVVQVVARTGAGQRILAAGPSRSAAA